MTINRKYEKKLYPPKTIMIMIIFEIHELKIRWLVGTS